ncbi:MAG TPA: hypothetical protein VGY97_00085 [Solirubrobacteraceae bacterium]|jgi:hypothetical protein|nr:hypothetical protein [Solirubrobacteraceae bacterium]
MSPDWTPKTQPGARLLRGERFLADSDTRGLRLLSVWFLLLALSWTVVAAVVWLVMIALGTA